MGRFRHTLCRFPKPVPCRPLKNLRPARFREVSLAAGARSGDSASIPKNSAVPESPAIPTRQPGHILVPGLTIGGLSITLAVGLAAFKAVDRANLWIASLVSRGGRETFPKHLPDSLIWIAAIILAIGIAITILATSGTWRRLVLWITAVMLIAAWAPVLSLAAHSPDIAVPWIATVWSGVCALVYASNHRMDAGETTANKP